MHPVPEPNAYDWDSPSDLAVRDFLSDEFNSLWHETARVNTEVFERLFRPLPNDDITTWAEYNEYLKPAAGIATGHVAEKGMGLAEVKRELERVKGHLVQMPLKFLEVSCLMLSRQTARDIS